LLTLTTEKEMSHGWNAVASRCDAAVSVASLSNSSSQATATTVGVGAAEAGAPSSTCLEDRGKTTCLEDLRLLRWRQGQRQ
jgi:hypothetical protein